MTENVRDIVIIGGGPAGISAGIYAARKQMDAVIVADHFGGQSMVSASVENWIGEETIGGLALAKKLEAHLRAQEGIEIAQPNKVTNIQKDGKNFAVTLDSGETYVTKSVLIATGAHHRHLNVPGEEQFIGKGVVFCSTCDAPMFRGRQVAVVGTGNSGLEAVEDLIPYAEKITLVSRSERIGGDPVTFAKIAQNEKVEVLYNATTTAIAGEVMVTGLVYRDNLTNEEKTLPVSGVFVEIGMEPSNELVKDLVDLDERGHVVVDAATGTTSTPGIFAAGDVTNVPFRQNNISAGDAIKALLSAYAYVKGVEVRK